METPDVIVIGGGIVGQVAAIEIAATGASVTLIDAGTNAGSTANAGSLHVQMQSRIMRLNPEQVPAIEASLPLYRAAVTEWERLDRAHGPFGLMRKGGLMVAESAEQLSFLEGKAEREARHGLDVDILDRDALDRIAPWLGSHVVGAELCRDEGKLDPLAANLALRAEARRLGVRILADEIAALEPGPRVTVRGRRDTYAADRVVVAASWGSGPLLESLGLAMPTLAEPLHMNITEPCAIAVAHLVQHAERMITLKQFASGQIVIGGGWPARGRGRADPPQVDPASMLANVALAGRLVPAIGRMRILRTWAGMNTTIDGISTAGPVPGHPRVVAAVPGDAGYTLGPLVARMAASFITGAAPPVDPAPYSPARFAA
ncbi:NAD(P)/FAD-dependent oxidoreductase [Jannaschia sp. KMU-145]|uniref:NAD(P)/FAD-dependent oxidoreductase n=1 Tax=Jannaschia halovivens TaxID=3388667 RepID=UPI00396B0E53